MAEMRLKKCGFCGKIFRFCKGQIYCSPKCRQTRLRYNQHRNNALTRNIPFLLTFEEWWSLWEQSGKWEQRGWRRGQYCMARVGDMGSYEIGNVRICLAEDNRAERNSNYPMAGARNPGFGKNYYANISLEEYERRGQAHSAKMAGLRWANDGKVNRRLKPPLPAGWQFGRVR